MPSRQVKKAKKLRVLLCDDETLFRDVIKDMLNAERGVEVVGEAFDGADAVKKAGELKPDVILMDIGLPNLTGIQATRVIVKSMPAVRVLMLSAYHDDMHVMESVQAGAYGYLSKKLPPRELVRALKVFAEQGTLLPPPLMEKAVSRLQRMQTIQTPLGAATRTQMRVLALLGMGKSNREIASELGCNVKTVKNHLNVLFQKFDVRNRTEAVVKAIKAGLIAGREAPP
ncbi:MAG: response regulator transcription factor [Elusimicrobia bacterium]|nr:response regulator transcription factor [Elusimicrobiota bacterium]